MKIDLTKLFFIQIIYQAKKSYKNMGKILQVDFNLSKF